MTDQEHEANDPMRERLKNLICDLYDIRPSDARRLIALMDTHMMDDASGDRAHDYITKLMNEP